VRQPDDIKKNCDNGTCNGGRAWTTDESCERDSSKMFCCGDCADEWVGKKTVAQLTDEEESSDEEPMMELTSAELYPQQIHIKDSNNTNTIKMSLLFNEIHTHYFAKATKLLDDEIEEGSEEDRIDIAQREFNDNECQYQNLYINIDELFLHDDVERQIPPFQVLRALDAMTEYIKDTLDCESVDVTKLEVTFALALAYEWASAEPTDEPTPTHEQAFIVDDEFGCEECRFCGWMAEFPESHLIRAMQSGCMYIEARHDLAVEMEREFG